MAKILKYKFLMNEINHGTEEPNIEQIFFEKTLTWCKENEEIAKREAYNGEYTIEDDGQPELVPEPSQLDRVESQIAYLAIITGNEEILEV